MKMPNRQGFDFPVSPLKGINLTTSFTIFCKLFPALLLMTLFAGCGLSGTGQQRANVHGKVTLNGEPVESGFVEFIPVAGVDAAPVKLTISHGSYDTASDPLDDRGVPLGSHKVIITSLVATGKKVKNEMGEMEEEFVQLIPKIYNSNSNLTADVTAGTTMLDFDLTP